MRTEKGCRQVEKFEAITCVMSPRTRAPESVSCLVSRLGCPLYSNRASFGLRKPGLGDDQTSRHLL